MAAAIKASLGDALASTIGEEDADLETFTDDGSNLSPRKYDNGNNVIMIVDA